MNRVRIIFIKEVLDSLRDRRSWFTGLFWALFGPLMMGGMFMLIGSTVREDIQKPLNLPVQNPEYAPNLIGFLEQRGVVIEPAPGDPQSAVKAGDVNVVLVIRDDYAEDFSSGRPAAVQLVVDSSRQSAQVDVMRIEGLLNEYGSYMGALRLVLRGVSPEIIRAVQIEEIDVATPQSQATFLVSFLPYFIIFAIFNGASPVIIDTTAGERERRSLEPLLINPVPRRVFVLGKMLAAFPFSMASLALTLAGFGAIFNFLPIEEYLGIRMSLDGVTLLWIFLTCLPIVFLASAIQMVVASFARSTKEAGTYLPFIALIPSLPGIALAFFPVKPALWTMLLPTFGQQILINQLMRLEPVDPWDAIISAGVTLVAAAGITLAAFRLYSREQLVFS